jgi:hypothetical protein
VAEDVVTMNSKALLQVDDEELEVALVYPEDADDRAGKLSVCSGIGTAILGYKRAMPLTGGFRTEPATSESKKCCTSRKLRAISIFRACSHWQK